MQMWSLDNQKTISDAYQSNTLEEKMDLIVFNEDCKKKSQFLKSLHLSHMGKGPWRVTLVIFSAVGSNFAGISIKPIKALDTCFGIDAKTQCTPNCDAIMEWWVADCSIAKNDLIALMFKVQCVGMAKSSKTVATDLHCLLQQ